MTEMLKESFYREAVRILDPAERSRDLVLAASNGELWKIRLLHEEFSTSVRAFDDEALVLAAQFGHLETVRYLLAEGCNANKSYSDGFVPYVEAQPFILAIENEHWEVARLLLERGANPAANGNQPMVAAIEKNQTDFILLLLETGRIDLNRGSVFEAAARQAPLETAAFLLGKMKDKDPAVLDQAFLAAAVRGSVEMMDLFLSHGADINARGGAAMLECASEGRTEAVAFLMERGAQLVDHALEQAFLRDQTGVLRLVLEKGCMREKYETFHRLLEASGGSSALRSACLVRAWIPVAEPEDQKRVQDEFRKQLGREFGTAGGDFSARDVGGRTYLVALILAGGFDDGVTSRFSEVKVEALLERDQNGLSAIDALAKYGRLNDLFLPHLWRGRCEELLRIWQEIAAPYRGSVDVSRTVSQLRQDGLKERARRGPVLRP